MDQALFGLFFCVGADPEKAAIRFRVFLLQSSPAWVFLQHQASFGDTMFLTGLLVFIISVALIAVGFLFLRRSISSSASGSQEQYVTQINKLQGDLKELMKYVDSYVSHSQHKNLMQMLEQSKTDLTREKGALKEIETKLDTAQGTVEEKEALQQEIKSAKEEDEIKLQNLMESYEALSSECIALEQQLATSLKELDKMLEELTLTAAQRTFLEDLSKALTTAGGLFRDLITEYASVNERLEMLRQQHQDLEDEYTKLAEQQLGE
ncbi:MAG: hypothetical protein GX589_11330 [Deltaproteobacteria bacterium]|nr:hypothetical protein [Deltaproteobacteria bacterium]